MNNWARSPGLWTSAYLENSGSSLRETGYFPNIKQSLHVSGLKKRVQVDSRI